MAVDEFGRTIIQTSSHFNIWAIILPFAFVITFFIIMTLFARQSTRHKIQRWWYSNKSLDIFIIKDNHFIINGVVPIQNKEFMYEKHKYIIDEECIVFEKSRIHQKPVLFYYEGNPNPIKFNYKGADTKFSGEELNKWANSQFIKQLLDTTSEKLIPIIMILIFVAIAVSAVGIYLQTKGQAQTIDMLRNLTAVMVRR